MTEPDHAHVYAVCRQCGHIEPRSAHTREDWQACELCGDRHPELADDLSTAEEMGEAV